MLTKKINKPMLVFNIMSVVALTYLLKTYSKDIKILDKLYNLKNWLFNIPIAFFRKYKKIKLPVIDRNITVTLSDEELEKKFFLTCNAVKLYRNKLKFEEWIYLYGLYKQSTIGNIKLNNEGKNEYNYVDNNNNKNNIDIKNFDNNNNNKVNLLNLNKNDFIENEKINSWKNCYGVDKKICKFLYVEYFNKLFPSAIENLTNDLSFDLSKSVSKMKLLKENSKGINNNKENNDTLCDIFCDNIVSNNLEYIKKTLKSNPYLINQRNSDGLTALHFACDRGYLETAKFLIENGADINIRDSYGDTPLHIAAYSDRKEIIDYLISVGADINKRNEDDMTVHSILNQK